MIYRDLHMVYDHLQDDISKKLFMARLDMSVTEEAGYFTMLPAEYRNLNADIEIFRMNLLAEDRERTVIFGAGFNGVAIAQQIKMKSLFAFIDNYRFGQTEENTEVPIFSLEEYVEKYGIRNTRFVISVSSRCVADEMYAQLICKGVTPEAVITIPPDYRNNTSQYFDLFTPNDHETFVDCGCFDVSTAFRFAGWCGTKEYDRIWCFEPDKESYEICSKLCRRLADCQVFPYGISDRRGRVLFESGGNENSRIVKQKGKETDDVIDTIALDEFLQDERVTFIKMDIEGAELDALRGSARIIKKQKPKLAISVYHRWDDIITIPKLILEIRPDYKLYIRHYSLLVNETVLYAL